MLTKKPAFKLAMFATVLSLFLALTLSTALLGDYNLGLQNYLNALIPKTLLGALILTLILTPAMAVGLPRQIAALSAGFLFGASYGALVAMISAIFACILTLLLARKLLTGIVQQRYPKPLTKVSHFFSHDTFLKALIIRLLPAGSNFLTNILAGTARSPVKPYVLGSALGFVPQMVVFSLMGAGLQVNGQQQLIVSIFLLGLALALGSYLYRKTKNNLTLS